MTTQRRNGAKHTKAPLCRTVLAVMLVITVCVVANGSSNLALATSLLAGKISPPPNWQLAFNSDFSGTAADPSVWGECYAWGDASEGCTNFGNGNEEKEWYQESQVKVDKGVLDLIASPEHTAGYTQVGQPEEYNCTSGMVTTFPSFSFMYGFVQVTARVPFGKGLWPAFWLLPEDEQWPPEIDILEHWGTETTSQATLHPIGAPPQDNVVSTPDINTGWHTFSLFWTPTSLTWWYDGSEVLATTTGVPQMLMYLVLNLAVDDDSPGGCNGTLAIKSVKVWVPPGEAGPDP